ncbi:unnamed protein product [Schistosoma rodhaini]|nr:unnamed protein product [Schistosoma rodhaini]
MIWQELSDISLPQHTHQPELKNKIPHSNIHFICISRCSVTIKRSRSSCERMPDLNILKEEGSKGQNLLHLLPKPVPPPTPVVSKPVASQRPSRTEPTRDLPLEVAPNLRSALEELSLDPSFKPLQNSTVENKKGSPSLGTNCRNTSCKQVYTGTDSDNGLCLYHPGVAVFHEGLKYWTCCNQKTSDFDAFLKQIGCTTGRHNWTVEDAKSTNATLTLQPNANCRFDWYQFGGCVTLDIYAKNIWPETVTIKVNQIVLHVSLKFGLDYQTFERDFNLYGSIDPKQSIVKLMPLKAEIILKKAEPITWPTLESKLLDHSEMNNNKETIEDNSK